MDARDRHAGGTTDRTRRTARGRAARAIAHVARRSVGGPLDRSVRVTLNFHPDRVAAGATVLERLARGGRYLSQFETGTSNGGLTAHPGGARWAWESRLFGRAYDDAPAVERPKYGALDHRRRGLGGAPRFGSAHLRLVEDVLDRSTFCFPDSVSEPTAVATADRFGLFPLVERWDARELTDRVEAREGGLLDDYVEAHVHGTVDLRRDVEAVVLDPCFRGSAVEEQAGALGVPVEWHDVGRRIAEDGVLDAAVIGRAVRAGEEDPQDLKMVWHCVARFGEPAGS